MKTLNYPIGANLPRVAMALLLGVLAVHHAIAGPDDEAKREMLAKHQTVAQFTGVKEYKCRGLTALCPDRCGHSGDMATFRILKYLAYEKPGKYGEPQEKQYQFLVQDNMKNLKVSPALKADVEALKVDDYVLLDWQHDYVTTQGGSKYPVRTVLQLKRITREEADKLTGGLDKLPQEESNGPKKTTANPANPAPEAGKR
jgi:hypothetical protein